MTNDTHKGLVDDLDDLLDRERQALINGELETLGRLIEQKEMLINRINGLDSLEHTQVMGLHSKVTRNQMLLNSAMEGIRAVAERMADLRQVRQSLETYDRDGRKRQFGTRIQTNVEKRA